MDKTWAKITKNCNLKKNNTKNKTVVTEQKCSVLCVCFWLVLMMIWGYKMCVGYGWCGKTQQLKLEHGKTARKTQKKIEM